MSACEQPVAGGTAVVIGNTPIQAEPEPCARHSGHRGRCLTKSQCESEGIPLAEPEPPVKAAKRSKATEDTAPAA